MAQIREAHLALFRAGAQIATSASYQASFEGFARRGLDQREAAGLMRRSVDLARAAQAEMAGDGRARWVAASVGPYGAALADGSEYRGRYGRSVRELAAWHCGEPRLTIPAWPSNLLFRSSHERACRMPGDYVTIEVNGREADQAAMSLLDHEGWGHFTAMQVRGGRVRGLDLHLSRLAAAHREVYGRALDGPEVRARIRHALGSRGDASVRVYGYWAGLIVTIREPRDMPRRPHSMTAVPFQRPLARLKHVGSWGQGRYRESALAAGFDEGLLVDETGRISEGTITNVGFWRDGRVIWPEAPKLDGITMLLLRRRLTAAGVGQAEEPVRVHDLARYQGMIVCNARGWAPVGRVDDLMIPQDDAFTGVIATALDGCPWDEI